MRIRVSDIFDVMESGLSRKDNYFGNYITPEYRRGRLLGLMLPVLCAFMVCHDTN